MPEAAGAWWEMSGCCSGPTARAVVHRGESQLPFRLRTQGAKCWPRSGSGPSPRRELLENPAGFAASAYPRVRPERERPLAPTERRVRPERERPLAPTERRVRPERERPLAPTERRWVHRAGFAGPVADWSPSPATEGAHQSQLPYFCQGQTA